MHDSAGHIRCVVGGEKHETRHNLLRVTGAVEGHIKTQMSREHFLETCVFTVDDHGRCINLYISPETEFLNLINEVVLRTFCDKSLSVSMSYIKSGPHD
jgi:hypothetical protein